MAVSDMEFGVGIHGEPGVAREPVLEAQQLARKVTDRILSDLPYGRSDEVALLVNGLGGTPLQELFILNREVHRILMDKGISVYRTFVGNYMTSLDMTGASVTLLRLDEQQKRLLDAPAKTIALTIA
jgi:dihydroxyacetone kinase